MLEFFRKYQKYCFILIAIVVIASFSFFGTFSTFNRDEKPEDWVIAKKIDDSELLLSEVRSLARFLATDQEDLPDQRKMPNLCNDGVIRNDLLRTGIADLLVEAYFDVFKEELTSKVERAKRFKGYAHPDLPLLSAAFVRERLTPLSHEELAHFREEQEISSRTFSSLSRLYQKQNDLPLEMLRQILIREEKRLGLRRDPLLEQGDLSLLGLHSLTDWFGHDFLFLSAEFILNGAALAEQKKYQVSLEEAKGDLLYNFERFIQKKGIDRSHFPSFHEHLQSLGFDETSAAKVWQKVLLFRRVFQGISQASFVDRLPFREFASFVHETAVLERYGLTEALHLKNLSDLVEFETYLSSISPPMEDPLALPTTFYSIDEVGKAYPELVQASFKAKVKELSLQEVSLRIPLKEVWSWQVEDSNWERLKKEFPFLKEEKNGQRFQFLETLTASERSQIESFSRLCILREKHPEWVNEALSSLTAIEKVISISQATTSLPYVSKPWRFYALLKDAVEGKEPARLSLLEYSDEGKTVYSVEEITPFQPLHVLTLEEAKKEGILSKIVDRKLEAAYAKIRKEQPESFQSKEGVWQPFAKVKDQIAEKVFSRIWQVVEKIPSNRLLMVVERAKKDLEMNPEDPKWIRQEGLSDPLKEQFKLEKREFLIKRTSEEEWMKEQAFTLLQSKWSPIHAPLSGDISFFYLKEKRAPDPLLLPQIPFGKELIAADAGRFLAEKLLHTILEHHAIMIPLEEKE